MADFKTHMTVSSVTGAVLSVAGYRANLPLDSCLVAGCLCSVSGMLPDLDSNSGRPLREATAMGAAVVPMLMVDRLQRLELTHDTMVLIAILTYITIRFFLAEMFRRFTVHRGMWHSLPAAAICGMVAFLVISNEDLGIRCYKTAAVVLGFLSHLILDEVWSVDFRQGTYRFKQSFGTALKLWGNNRKSNLMTYAKLLIISALVYQDQGFMSRYHINPHVPHTFGELMASIKEKIQKSTERSVGEPLMVDSDPPALPVWNDGQQNLGETMNGNNADLRNSTLPTNGWPARPNQGWQ
jgi:membrane-bound metal-dependent hydrolase YbcI (DUF457 family)